MTWLVSNSDDVLTQMTLMIKRARVTFLTLDKLHLLAVFVVTEVYTSTHTPKQVYFDPSYLHKIGQRVLRNT